MIIASSGSPINTNGRILCMRIIACWKKKKSKNEKKGKIVSFCIRPIIRVVAAGSSVIVFHFFIRMSSEKNAYFGAFYIRLRFRRRSVIYFPKDCEFFFPPEIRSRLSADKNFRLNFCLHSQTTCPSVTIFCRSIQNNV